MCSFSGNKSHENADRDRVLTFTSSMKPMNIIRGEVIEQHEAFIYVRLTP